MSQLKILKTETIAGDQYLFFKKTTYQSKTGETRTWSYSERPSHIEAAVIIPITKETKEIILIRQFRIPMQNYVIEFPAGLMEPGEKIEVSALRELEEETGYKGKIISTSPKTSSSAGISSETIYLIHVETEEIPQAQNLEDCEEIEVLRTPLKKAKQLLLDYSAKGDLIDSKVWAFLALAQD